MPSSRVEMGNPVIKWIALSIVVAALIAGNLQGFWLSKTVNELKEEVEEKSGSLEPTVVKQTVTDIFGGGKDISPLNPLHVFEEGGHSLVGMIVGAAGRGVDHSWLGVEFEAEGQWRFVKPSEVWYDNKFHMPSNIKRRSLYTAEVFRYPLWAAEVKWNSLAGNRGRIAWFGLYSGPLGGAWFHRFRDADNVDHLGVLTADGNVHDITSLVPSDWITTPYWYQIRVFPDGAEFFVNNRLVAVIVNGPDLQNGYHETVSNVLFGTGSNKNMPGDYQPRNWIVPYLRGVLEIEPSGTNEYRDYTIDLPLNRFSLGDTDGDYARAYRAISLSSLPAASTSGLTDCLTIPVIGKGNLNLTVKATYPSTAGAKIRLYTSVDAQNWDTEPVETKTLSISASGTKQHTFSPSDAIQRAKFIKGRVENLDGTSALTNIEVTATLGGEK